MRITLIYLTYNSESEVRENLPRLLQSAGAYINLIAIDNASQDGTVQALRELGIEPTVMPENVGYTKGINIGLQKALELAAPWIVIVNPDAVPSTPNWAQALLNYVDTRVGIIGCKQVRRNYLIHGGGEIAAHKQLLSWWQEYDVVDRKLLVKEAIGASRVLHRMGHPAQYNKDEYVPWVTFAVVALRKEAVQEIGLLNEEFWLYCSDAEYCFRAWQAGWFVLYRPVVFVHECGTSIRRAPDWVHERAIADAKRWLQIEDDWIAKVQKAMAALLPP
ncbi:MAG: glycosyltransferase family 2 protein [Deltaproteobacteria bacterium]|nr:glycosyltransferase family 2 protein [Deltaproteobacteria bacterium]